MINFKYQDQWQYAPVHEPYRFHPVTPSDEVDDRGKNILIDSIHDGCLVPEELQKSVKRNCEKFEESFYQERDWGASLLAEALAQQLDLPGFREVAIARNVLDFGRFPGISDERAAHLDRLSFSGPLAGDINAARREVLLKYYRRISQGLEDAIEATLPQDEENPIKRLQQSRFIRIAIHTFDKLGPDDEHRPIVEIIHRSKSLQEDGRLPDGVFSRLFPHELASFSADRLLKHAISMALEKNYIPEMSDATYLLPEGTVEMRAQVWFWFKYLRACFEVEGEDKFAEVTDQVGEDVYENYWKALMNPSAVNPDTRRILDYIEGRAYALDSQMEKFADLDTVLMRFLKDSPQLDGVPRLVRRYQYDAYRPSFIVIEVRKDQLFVNPQKKDFTVRKKKLTTIARSIAEGINLYRTFQAEKKDQTPFRDFE